MSGNANNVLVVVIGSVIGAGIGLLLVMLCNKNGKPMTDYDERQANLRAKGYKWAYLATWIMIAIYMGLVECGIDFPVVMPCCLLIIGIISIGIQVSYSIWHDAYFGLNNDVKKFLVTFAVIGILQLGTLIISFVKEGTDMFAPERINTTCISIAVEGLVAIVYMQVGLKSIIDKRKEEED